MNPVVWQPSEHDLRSSRIAEFAQRVEQQHRVTLPDYAALHRWSVERLDDFWSAVWTFFDVGSHRPTAPALALTAMPGATWFPQEELNYVAHAFQQRDADDRTAIIDASEPEPMLPKSDLSWRELKRQVASLAHTLSSNGIGRGDRVVGYLPNIPETVVAFLATASLGAVWAGWRAGLRRRRGARPLRTVGACSADYRRWLLLQRQVPGQHRECREPAGTVAQRAAGDRRLPCRYRRQGHARLGRGDHRQRRAGPAAGAVRSPAVGRVLVGNDGTAEGHRARARWSAARTPQVRRSAPQLGRG